MNGKTDSRNASVPAQRWFKYCASAALVLIALPAASRHAEAMSVQPLFNDLCQYYILDSDTCSAQAVLECLTKSGGSLSGMQQCAAQHDAKAHKFIEIYAAATKPDYVRLIELAGPVIACRLLPPGPPTNVLCSAAIRPIVTKAFGKAAKIYDAASKGDWLTVIYVVGDPALACEVVPSFPGKDLTCGAVAQLLVEGGKLLQKGAEAGIDVLEEGAQALGNVVSSGLQSLGLGGAGVAPEAIFYQSHGRPLLHQRALRALTSTDKAPFLGFDTALMKQCTGYVTSTSSLAQWATAQCEHKSQQLHEEARALADLVRVAPAAYFENVQATASLLSATNWSSGGDRFIAAMKKLPRPNWSSEGLHSLPSPFSALLGNCYENTRAAFPVPVGPTDFLADVVYPPNLWGWVCGEAGLRLANAMVAEKMRLTTQVIPLLTDFGCAIAKTGDDSLKFDCDNGKALSACHALLPSANPNTRCRRSADFNAANVASVSQARQMPAVQGTGAIDTTLGRPAETQLVAPPKGLVRAIGGALAAAPVTIEGEALLRSGAVRVSGGAADVQPMQGFGSGWSGNEQLFWGGGAPGDTMDLSFDVSTAGRYTVEMVLTRAPDYGRLRFELNGEPGADSFDGFDPGVIVSAPLPVGTFTLPAGTQRLRIAIAGRSRQSSGHLAGIDRLQLIPATPGN